MKCEIYEEMYKIEMNHWWFLGRRKIVYDIISKYKFKIKNEILDIGCGTGGNLEMLSTLGNVTALEMNESAIDFAKERNVGEIVKGSLPSEIMVEKKFDVISLLDVLEHVEEDKKSLEQLHRMLEDFGFVILTVPAYKFLWSNHDIEHHHLRRYSRKELRTLVEEAGFSCEFISYYNTLLFPLALINRVIVKVLKTDTNLKPPSFLINRMFTNIFSFESKMLKYCSFFYGLSLIAILRKNVISN